MIIALDGNVFVGKTTLCNIFSKKNNYNVVLEYSNFINKTKNKSFKQINFSEHSKYLKLDNIRKKYLKNNINFIDRSFVSLSAHIYALYKNGIADFRIKHINSFYQLLKSNNIIIPDYYVFITCNYNCAKKRFLLEKRIDGKKGTPTFFINKDYFLAINEFNSLWQKNIKNGLIIDTSHSAKKNNQININNNFVKKLTKKQIITITKTIFFSDDIAGNRI